MANNYDDYKPINPQPPRKRKNIALIFIRYAILTLLLVALMISAIFFVTTHKKEKNNLPDKQTSPSINTEETEDIPEQEDTTVPEETTPVEPPKPTIDVNAYTNVDTPKANINKGSLIFVSGNYKVVFPTAEELVNISTLKSKSYQLSLNTMKAHKDIIGPMNKMFDDFAAATGKNDVMLWTSYRDEARQQQVYDNYVKEHGEEAAKTAVAKGGESEHNTGLGVIIGTAKEKNYYNLLKDEGYKWIEDNCHKYGFIVRYPSSKVEKTGLNYSESFYLRYVGTAHAQYMKENDLCLEEYLTKVKEYAFGTVHLDYTAQDGTIYEIYYVSGETEGDVVKVPVPIDREYTISGNNIDGFIVSVIK